jgi:hypothetical protein
MMVILHQQYFSILTFLILLDPSKWYGAHHWTRYDTFFSINSNSGVYFNEALIVPALQSNITSQFLNTDLINQYNNFGGVRIEDTILITDTGFEVLSAGVPKLVGDITMIMNQQ